MISQIIWWSRHGIYEPKWTRVKPEEISSDTEGNVNKPLYVAYYSKWWCNLNVWIQCCCTFSVQILMSMQVCSKIVAGEQSVSAVWHMHFPHFHRLQKRNLSEDSKVLTKKLTPTRIQKYHLTLKTQKVQGLKAVRTAVSLHRSWHPKILILMVKNLPASGCITPLTSWGQGIWKLSWTGMQMSVICLTIGQKAGREVSAYFPDKFTIVKRYLKR